ACALPISYRSTSSGMDRWRRSSIHARILVGASDESTESDTAGTSPNAYFTALRHGRPSELARGTAAGCPISRPELIQCESFAPVGPVEVVRSPRPEAALSGWQAGAPRSRLRS